MRVEPAETGRFTRADLFLMVLGGSPVALALRLLTGVDFWKAVGQTSAGVVGAAIFVLVLGDRFVAWLEPALQRRWPRE